jgi:arylsulfatase A-like enzyme
VIVSIDGLRPDSLTSGGAITIQTLAARGTYTLAGRTINPSTTVPSHVSMLTGYTPGIHGITWDDWRPERGFPPVPTILQLARAAGLRTSLVVGKDKLKVLALPGSTQFYLASGTEAVANQAVAEIEGGVDVLVVHFPDVDLTGHAQGWMSTPYLGAVGETDHALARIVDALGERTTLIVTADHGGNGKDHGAGTNLDMTIPWVAVGPGVPQGKRITRSIRTTDTAATAARILGLALAGDADGKAITEIFGTGTTAAVPFLALAGDNQASTLFVRPEKTPAAPSHR